MLLDGLLGVLGGAPDPQTEHHLEGDRKQQQSAGDPERGDRDAELPQQPVADQRRADQDRAGDQAGAERHLCGATGPRGHR